MNAYLYLSRDAFSPEEFGQFVEATHDGNWMPDYLRASVSTEDGTVYLDYLGDCFLNEVDPLAEEELAKATVAFGVRPQTAIVVGPSSHWSNSYALAASLLKDFERRWGGSLVDSEMLPVAIEELRERESRLSLARPLPPNLIEDRQLVGPETTPVS